MELAMDFVMSLCGILAIVGIITAIIIAAYWMVFGVHSILMLVPAYRMWYVYRMVCKDPRNAKVFQRKVLEETFTKSGLMRLAALGYID